MKRSTLLPLLALALSGPATLGNGGDLGPSLSKENRYDDKPKNTSREEARRRKQAKR